MSEFPPLQQPDIDGSVFVADTARIHGDVTIGPNASVWFGVSIRAEAAPVTVGAGTNLQDNVVIHTDADLPAHLGANVTVGHGAIVHGATVEDGALVGIGAIVLNGATVESGALVAAGTLVPPGATVPAGMLVVGNPMRIVRQVRAEENESTTVGRRHYQHYAGVYRTLSDEE